MRLIVFWGFPSLSIDYQERYGWLSLDLKNLKDYLGSLRDFFKRWDDGLETEAAMSLAPFYILIYISLINKMYALNMF